jgi:polyferredoxin
MEDSFDEFSKAQDGRMNDGGSNRDLEKSQNNFSHPLMIIFFSFSSNFHQSWKFLLFCSFLHQKQIKTIAKYLLCGLHFPQAVILSINCLAQLLTYGAGAKAKGKRHQKTQESETNDELVVTLLITSLKSD